MASKISDPLLVEEPPGGEEEERTEEERGAGGEGTRRSQVKSMLAVSSAANVSTALVTKEKMETSVFPQVTNKNTARNYNLECIKNIVFALICRRSQLIR